MRLASMRRQSLVSLLNQLVITISGMTRKTKLNTRKNQKISRKMREAIKTLRFSLQILSMICSKSYLRK